MAPLSDVQVLSAAWRALEGSVASEGWRTIPIGTSLPGRLFAGRHYPGNEETVLVSFPSVRSSPVGNLPQGSGFSVTVAEFQTVPEKQLWLALRRLEGGSIEIFAMMASDVIAILESSESKDDDHLLDLFLGRIRAWQDFMQHGRNGMLGREAEIGLFGEIVFLASLLRSEIQPLRAIGSWRGPFEAIHDFQLGTGAIEVKTTAASSGFPAKISSLDQLDDRLAKPLFLAAVRLRQDEAGCTLPDQIALVRSLLQSEPKAISAFETRLLHAGFFSMMSPRYTRRFLHDSTRLFTVQEDFPRLIRSGIPAGIIQARYELDLDSTGFPDMPLNAVLRSIGVLK
jgi:hypothetical protein